MLTNTIESFAIENVSAFTEASFSAWKTTESNTQKTVTQTLDTTTHTDVAPHTDTPAIHNNAHVNTTPHANTDASHSNLHANTTPHSNGGGYHSNSHSNYTSHSNNAGYHNNGYSLIPTHTDYDFGHYNTTGAKGVHIDSDPPHSNSYGYYNSHTDYAVPHSNTTPHTNGTGHNNYVPHSNYTYHSNNGQHSNTTPHANGTTHNNNGLHSNVIPHANYTTHTNAGFDHQNYVPSKPNFFSLDNASVLKGTVTVGLFSYDKNTDGVGTQDAQSKTVKYTLQIRKIKNLDGSANVSAWRTLLSNSALETYSLNTIDPLGTGNTVLANSDGYYEIQAVSQNDSKSINGVSKNYVSPSQTITVKVQQNTSPTVSVTNGTEFIGFTFGGGGAVSASGVYKDYSESLYAEDTSSTQEGLFTTIAMTDVDNSNYQKAVAYLKKADGTVIPGSQVNVIWTNGTTITASNGIAQKGYAFFSKDVLKASGLSLQNVNVVIEVTDYMDSACTVKADSTVVISTVSATDTTKLLLNIDAITPTITITENTTNPVQSATINVTTADDLSGVQKIQLPDGTWVNGITASYNVTENGTYSFTVKDKGGNTTSKSITISNIDKLAPTVPSLSADKTIPTNGNVIVAITYPADANVKQYKIGNTGTWTNYTVPVTISSNDTVYAKAQDVAGNWSTEGSLAITNIDKIAPVITVNPYTTTPVNTDITITATTNEGTLDKVSHTFTENGSFEFVATDEAGNVTKKTITVDNIDKTAPIITIDDFNTEPTNKPITVSASVNEGSLDVNSHTFSENGTFEFVATDDAGNVTKKTVTITNMDVTLPIITIDDYSNEYTNSDITVTATTNEGSLSETSHTFTENGDFTFIATDDVGNVSEKTVSINNIDKTAPTTPAIFSDKDKLTIAGGTDSQSGVDKTLYQLNNGEWIIYTGEVTLPDDAYAINSKTIDKVGNESAISTHNTVVFVTRLADAKTAMDKAEATDTQADLNSAKALIEALPTECTEKTALQNRVADQQIIVTALVSVEAINPNSSLGDITIAIGAVNNLPNSQVKVQLQADIATVAVNKAVTTKTQTDIDYAWSTLLPLADGTLKTSLDAKLVPYDEELRLSTNDVTVAENYLTETFYKTATDSVNALAQHQHKDALLTRLATVREKIDAKVQANADTQLNAKILDATKAVETAEASPIRTNIETALSKVRALDDSVTQKAGLLARAESLRDAYNTNLFAQQLETSTSYVVKAESYQSTYYLTKAQTEVDKLPECPEKASLQERLNKVSFTIAVTNATSAVVKAEKYKTSTYITNAQKLITALPESPEKVSLQARLDVLK